ncbi:hypothetical protein M885DRAFT_518749 [Pelagophyceae sp. CCMP2097]|nr:hypothetical protein M885DRAFT_518749 [Pelagophyceae sp. CCMP2097]
MASNRALLLALLIPAGFGLVFFRRASHFKAAAATRRPATKDAGDALMDVLDIEACRGKRVALYFAAGWCPMCTGFEPSLIAFRAAAAVSTSATAVELVYVGSDGNDAAVAARAKRLGMAYVPPGAASELKKRFKVWAGKESGLYGSGRRSGVPALVVLTQAGDEAQFLAAESRGAAALNDWREEDVWN